MIKDGEFFDANGEDKCYAQMMKNGDLEDRNHNLANGEDAYHHHHLCHHHHCGYQ
jgi:hypothetical protein